MATKWGIAGAGYIAQDFATALRTLSPDEHEIVAVAARDLERAQEFSLVYNIPTSYSSYRQLATNPDIQVVYIGTINPSHFEISKLMLEHGKHVLCEKPLTMSEKDTATLIKLARERKLFLMEAIWSRCFPVYKFIRQQLFSESIGSIVQVNAHLCMHMESDRVKTKELGGGTILDLGVYVLQFALLVFGPEMPVAVKAVGHVNKGGVDDSAAIVLTYPGKKTAVLSTSSLATMSNDAFIFGTKGSIKLLDPFYCSTKVVVCKNSTELNTKNLTEFPLPPTAFKFNYQNSCGLRYQAEEVRRCIKSGLLESPLVTHQESITIARLEQKIHELLGVNFD